VAIIGGGPAGSTCACLLKKYNPGLDVVIVEKEAFPREHVGESQLPGISMILWEMGCWEKVEAAGFPIKVGATYRWGQSEDLWDFDFVPERFAGGPRPARYEGERQFTAFQVDREVYDTILLDHARQMGCRVLAPHAVRRIARGGSDPDRVEALELDGGGEIHGRHFVDASGHVGVLRRGMGVGVREPTRLRNIAVWDYWENARWAVKIGVGGTRVFVLSIGTGWLWFIPLSPTRTSLGFVCSAEHYKQSGRTPEQLYLEAIAREPFLTDLTRDATREGHVRSTKDWSFLAERMHGSNWFLAGESAGFADPILAGGMMLAHAGAREVAYTILELERGTLDAAWLRERYTQTQRQRIGQHIRFADFWYAGNGCFRDLQACARRIADDAGVATLNSEQAFRWLSTGGFAVDQLDVPSIGAFDIASTKRLMEVFGDGQARWRLNDFNVFRLNLRGAATDTVPYLHKGRILEAKRYVRGDKSLAMAGLFGIVVRVLERHCFINDILKAVREVHARQLRTPANLIPFKIQQTVQILEVLLADGWVDGSLDPGRARVTVSQKSQEGMIHPTQDVLLRRS